MVGDEHLAEDIFQEVSIAAINKHSDIANEEHFGGWIRRAAKYQAITALRGRNRLPLFLPDDLLGEIELSWQRFDKKSDSDLRELLRGCLSELGPYAYQLIKTRYIDGKSGDEFAAAMQRSKNTVYVALARIHTSLKECIKRRLLAEVANG
jgi:RNA polymerase sigma factor (sigma-70 family)